MTITVSTDGSALGNPNGPMGWAWADHTPHAGGTPGHEHEGDCDAGGASNGTNQIGELCAVLEALRAHPGAEPLVIESDSQYAINCSTTWVRGWKKHGWKNSQGKPVKNRELIAAIDREISQRPGPVKFVWVKGHNNNPGNEKVDHLAHGYAGDCRSGVKPGYLPLEGWQSLLASEYAKGTIVPEDAHMLMEGRISAAEYHLGRAEDTGGVPGAGDGQRTDRGQSADGGPVSRTSSGSGRAESLAERLAEPEGVPDDLPDYHATAGSVDAIDTADSATTAIAANKDNTASDTPSVSDVAPAAIDSATTATAEAAESGNSEIATSPAAGQAAPTHNTAAASVTPAPSGVNRLRPVPGLTLSGTLRFSPPPSSSPTFSGEPRRIHGLVEIDGYVQGDGSIELNGARFMLG
ncbi:ribonuclease H family protein [Bifidobacterium thermacidophilum]|uniref:ribonuclease H n=1 Tax=Bifidobacterium thermacidophilum subsp. thermacidophilum TaxID=79262 RepID=A0A087E6C6_9BIFI|nr:ribonuclease H [Bifidobacterium thermacidophilum]KFJ03327.1 ribonuclease H [Bifidobacterium thermacidophilum subsp. thermacidophilum]